MMFLLLLQKAKSFKKLSICVNTFHKYCMFIKTINYGYVLYSYAQCLRKKARKKKQEG